MPWPPRRSSRTEIELQKEITTLQLKLLRTNSELQIKTVYCQRLEFLLHERSERIDQLTGIIDQLRERNRRLEAEAEHLAELVAASAETHQQTGDPMLCDKETSPRYSHEGA